MAKPFRLRTLLEHARHRLEAAERLLRMLRRKEEDAQRRLDELRQYHADYQARLAGRGQVGIDIQLWRDYHVFLIKLEAAVRHQEGEVAQLHGHWLKAQTAWLEQRKRVRSFEVLAQRQADAEMRRQDKLEQRMFDELAGRQSARRGQDEG